MSATVVISTLGRSTGCARTVQSVIAALGPADRLVVVDQSDDHETERAVLLAAGVHPRVSYLRSSRRGISAGHNLGAVGASTDLLLFTDDDCVVSRTWADDWRRVFIHDRAIGMGFGTVACEPFDSRTGFTPHFKPEHSDSHSLEVFRQPVGSIGMGANTAGLTRAWLLVGGCDEALGIGTVFGGAEEMDLAYRILRRGFRLSHAAQPTVMHDGFRPGDMASSLVQTNAMGTGAMYAKHVRCGDFFALRLLSQEVINQIGQVASRLIRHRRPLGFRRLRAILLGVAGARRLAIDRARRLYIEAPAG